MSRRAATPCWWSRATSPPCNRRWRRAPWSGRRRSTTASLAPGHGQVLRRTYHAVEATTGRVRHEVTYGITSLPAAATTPAEVERLWRGHWTIENRVHHARDVAFGEDANQARAGSAPQALAALRNALAHYGAYLHRALHLLHHRPARL
ncbi:MAG: transposase [Chloroflexia bacterium]